MPSPMLTVTLVCLVAAVVLLAVRNRALTESLEGDRKMSVRSLNERNRQFDICSQDLVKAQKAMGNLETQRNLLVGNQAKLEREIDSLKVEVADRVELAATIEGLRAHANSVTIKKEQLQSDLTYSQEKVKALETEMTNLQNSVNGLKQKLTAAEESARAAAAIKPAEPNAKESGAVAAPAAPAAAA